MRTDIEFQQLEQFVTVARARNFTRAAVELNLSQSALSRAIRKLEDQIGQPLFERKPREVVLTDLGELLLERAKEILKLVEDTFSLISESGRKGRIRLGAIPTIAPYFLPRLLSSFAAHHPDVSLNAAVTATLTSPSSPCPSSPGTWKPKLFLKKSCSSSSPFLIRSPPARRSLPMPSKNTLS